MARTGASRPQTGRKGFQKQPDIDLGFLGRHVGFQVHIARRALRQAMRDFRSTEERQNGRPPPPGGAISSLVLIGLNPGISQQQIAATLFLDPSKAAILIKNLVAAGFIEKRPTHADRRRVELYITAQGRENLSQAQALSETQESRIGLGLTASEQHQLVALLVKLQDALR